MISYVYGHLDGRKMLLVLGKSTNNTFENKFEKGHWMEFENLVLGTVLKIQFGKLVRCMMGARWGKGFLEFGMVPTILLNIYDSL